MAVRDWHIFGDMATREANGQDIRVTTGNFPSIYAAIEDWETRERARQARDLRELSRLVDSAIARLQAHHGAGQGGPRPNGRDPR
ncbi:hypothetical protein GCM10022252_35330 [Streptosporangium oxazolinicum]|uniref:Uncharacterized protein n=1 Tax=Streptosporangium oxazolinicum TaxID=909287 RepID=A0ABP8AXQ1_9ACTN